MRLYLAARERHTGVAIRKQTETDLENVIRVFEDIDSKVSDQGSNMKKAWVACLVDIELHTHLNSV